MSDVKMYPIEQFSINFVNESALPAGESKYYYRNPNAGHKFFRNLEASEIETLVKNNNFAENWNEIFVSKEFNANCVINNEFFGKVLIGKLSENYLEYNDLKLPVGIYNSTIISCEIGDNVSIRNANYLSHYIVGNNCILFNIDEMITSDRSKFGNGILKEGEEEEVRIWIEVGNENGGRKILPFDKIITADAYIWSKYRDDKELLAKLAEITNNGYSKKRGYYGLVGSNSVIKHCRIIKDVNIGEYCYIKGANKLKNLTINSSKLEPTQIGEGVELVNGIIGFSAKIFYGCKAVRFVTGRNTQVKYGARLLNSILGDNSTVSCCELLNNLIFPFHEQHHNTSFLIAATVLGQSNIAAGATIGSNHNSRSADGEVLAGRGFWPGLSSDFKHNSKFASFVLISKGSYAYEMNVTYPFSLVFQNKSDEAIQIIPAYWFIYNMYAIERNLYKFANRDKRKIKIQNIESEYLAPDTVSEIIKSIDRIYVLAGESINKTDNLTQDEYLKIGKEYIRNLALENKDIELKDKECMKKYGAKILKPVKAVCYFEKMILYFLVKNIVNVYNIATIRLKEVLEELKSLKKTKLYLNWINLGGQIVSQEDLEDIKKDIKNDKLTNWDEIHERYNDLWKKYPKDKLRFSIYAFETILDKNVDLFTEEDLKKLFEDAVLIKKFIYSACYDVKKKDYADSYRKMLYDNEEEMIAVIGDIKDNDFLIYLEKETGEFENAVKNFINRE
ncbi:MAG TPA: DUF4954 family protein [Spirochaetota bacterium]|nr:DUF4954 family protein [Spirochaetota bacterium]HOS32425.1 DUF4954 family protein [Spirochaetota bacterium]HOS55832.1 DUF4954 family protein [Spirochaetota bacterium]HPK61807.1 DUF4954 family protein [Spirochaetota bacterium]HQF77922.1 DUF4954 family protein [Spirochaetota bacterium]